MNIADFIERITILKPNGIQGGLEISDFAARFVRFRKGAWEFYAERFPPAVLQNGEVKDPEEFVATLRRLHAQIVGEENSKKRVRAVASLNAGSIYSQVFTLPLITGENLEKAIELNLQVISPEDLSTEYASWEIVNRDPVTQNIEIFASFVGREFADGVRRALAAAGFSVQVLEFRALALTRLVREAAGGFDAARSYLVLALNNDGLDALVVRRGKLYFEYFTFWRDMFQNESRAVPISVFESAVLRNVNQVFNFYNQHWPNDRVAGVFVSAGELSAEAGRIIQDNFSLPAIPLVPKGEARPSSEWFVAWGSAIRAVLPRRKDRELNLLGEEAREELRREWAVNFLEFWRTAIPVSLAAFLALFVSADFFLTRMHRELEAKLPPASVDLAALAALQAKAKAFNSSVAFIRSVREEVAARSPVLEKIGGMAQAAGVRIDTFIFPESDGEAVKISGEAQTTEKILAFKARIDADASFSDANLPITEIRPTVGGQSFTMTFFVNSATAR